MEEESQNAQDARVEKLWVSLHDGPIKPLDLEGLRRGLKKIDHRRAFTACFNILLISHLSLSKRRHTTSRSFPSC
jgi:hypothetical protein